MATNNAVNNSSFVPAFQVALNASIPNATGAGAGYPITWDAILLDNSSAVSGFSYYIPKEGIWQFNYTVFFSGFTGGATTFIVGQIDFTGATYDSSTSNIANIGANSFITCSNSFIAPYPYNHRLYLNAVADGGTATVSIQGFFGTGYTTQWSGCWLGPL